MTVERKRGNQSLVLPLTNTAFQNDNCGITKVENDATNLVTAQITDDVHSAMWFRLGLVFFLGVVYLGRSEHGNCSQVGTKTATPGLFRGGGLILVTNKLWNSLFGS